MWKSGQNESEPNMQAPTRSAAPEGQTRTARLGPSIRIKGALTGEEDLLIEGAVEGEVTFGRNKVTIGESGRVQADIRGSSICVEGEVKGNLFGEEQVIIRRSGKVRGNVTAPRVNLENGAKFKGAIDMQPGADSSGPRSTEPATAGAKAKTKASGGGGGGMAAARPAGG